jgi:hypothetical protein
VAISKSAAAEIGLLIDGLCSADAVARETASARLAVIGARAVPHLVSACGRVDSPEARATILKALESAPDRRSVDLAVDELHAGHGDPRVRAAAVMLLGAHLEHAEGPRALDELSAFALDAEQPDALRLQSLDVIARALPRVAGPLRKLLAVDASAAIRAWAAASASPSPAVVDPRMAIEAAAAGEPVDPSLLRELVPAGAADAPLPTLHRLIEIARTREAGAPAPADKIEWRAVRGAVHLALARRSSRVAVYDLREALAGDAESLPEDFVDAVRIVGDASCLEPIAERLARFPTPPAPGRGDLAGAGRAIVEREKLTRRHAVIRKVARLSPAIAAEFLPPPRHS